MNLENTYFPVSNLFSKQLNLSDFGFEKPAVKKIKEINNTNIIKSSKIHPRRQNIRNRTHQKMHKRRSKSRRSNTTKNQSKNSIYSIKKQNKSNQEIYSRRNNVESIFSVIKEYSTERTEAKAYNYQTKKQNSKTQSTTFTDQPKFNKNEDFYKAILNKR